MRAYLVEITAPGNNFKKYVGTQADVVATKKTVMSEGFRRKDIKVTEVDIPDDKQGKLDFINKLIQLKQRGVDYGSDL